MTELLYEFKQGNKVLTKIYKENNSYHVFIPIGRGGGVGADYDLEVNAVQRTHDYIIGVLSISKNKNYTLLHYERISQYIQVYKYVYSGGELVKDGKLYKTIAA